MLALLALYEIRHSLKNESLKIATWCLRNGKIPVNGEESFQKSFSIQEFSNVVL